MQPVSPRRPRPSRLGRLLAVAAAGVLALTACSNTDAQSTGAPASSGATDRFPVSVEHTYGATEIPDAPQRIVTVGLSDQDAVLALGLQPVGVVDWYGDYPNAVWPWQEDLYGSEVPQVVGDSTDLRYEAIAALEPDLILGLYSGLTRNQYDTLTRIAPTVAQPAGFPDYGAPWQETTMITGEALGKSAEAKELVADVEAQFEQVREQHPEFAGNTAAAAGWNGPGLYFVYGPDDPKTRFLASLGFTVPDVIKNLGDDFGLEVSPERLDLVNQDLAVWFTSTTPELIPELEASQFYQSQRVAQEGRDLFLGPDDKELNGAVSWSTVLSLPRAIDGLVPRLPAVLDGDPATAPPPA